MAYSSTIPNIFLAFVFDKRILVLSISSRIILNTHVIINLIKNCSSTIFTFRAISRSLNTGKSFSWSNSKAIADDNNDRTSHK
jgi:hypothetical protein